MSQNRISENKISKILEFYALSGLNKTQISKTLNIARGTVIKYIGYYERSNLTYTDLLFLKNSKLIPMLYQKQTLKIGEKLERLLPLFPAYHKRLSMENANLKQLWEEYFKNDPSPYRYSSFVSRFHEWRQINSIEPVKPNKWRIEKIGSADLKQLNQWRLSSNRSKWERAVVLLGLYKGKT